MFRFLTAGIILLLTSLTSAQAAIRVVAAENMYGELAKQLGGQWVEVDSILSNPNQDPHLFSATPKAAKKITNAQLIIMNGAGYDSWMQKLLVAHKTSQQKLLNVATLTQALPGANPHLWYQPETMLLLAKQLVVAFSEYDPEHSAYFQQQLQKFIQEYQKLQQKIEDLHHQYAGTAVIATEPVFGYMSNLLGFSMQGQGLQQSIMNDVEPSPSQLKEVDDLLRQHKVSVLFYNKQIVNPLTQHLQALAQEQHIPTVGVTELQPANMDYVSWMLAQLEQLDQALHHAKA